MIPFIDANSPEFHVRAALLLALAMALVVGSALGFEHIGGYIPCKLCLAQREPYYLGLPVALVAAFSAWRGWPANVTRGALLIAGLLMAYTLTLAVNHSGVEWGLWAGPTDCGAVSGGLSGNVGDLASDLVKKTPPACDRAAGRFLGLSFAGWNAIASFGLAAFALYGAWVKPKPHQGRAPSGRGK